MSSPEAVGGRPRTSYRSPLMTSPGPKPINHPPSRCEWLFLSALSAPARHPPTLPCPLCACGMKCLHGSVSLCCRPFPRTPLPCRPRHGKPGQVGEGQEHAGQEAGQGGEGAGQGEGDAAVRHREGAGEAAAPDDDGECWAGALVRPFPHMLSLSPFPPRRTCSTARRKCRS